jgi:nicotinamide-nucleotide amidase
LADVGYVVTRQVAVADRGEQIQQAVREALSRADLVISTGGLGPTSDDLTRNLIAELLGKELHEDAAVLAQIKSFFDLRRRPMPELTSVQALVPEGALVLANPHGTAPGLAMKVTPNAFREQGAPAWLIMLPGPPRELRPMFLDTVVPLLQRELPLNAAFVCQTLRTTGLGESLVQQRIHDPLAAIVEEGLEVGYCARPWQVDVRLSARGSGAAMLVAKGEQIVRQRLQENIFASGDQDLAHVIISTLSARKETLVLAESCTGGFLTNQLTNVPGASAVIPAGMVTYSNEAKQKLLGVQSNALSEHGAVSEQVAAQMAEGARKLFEANYALAVTGIAGPGGGTPEKPVGTVFIALAGPGKTDVHKRSNPYDRETFKAVTTQQALELLRRKVIALPK